MKIKTIMLAAAMGAGLAGVSQAQTNYVYMTGSTAFRSIAFAVLNDSTGTSVFDSNSVTFVGYKGSSAGGATYMLFAGKIGGTNTTVKCDWTGSEAGVSDVSTTNGEAFLSDSVIAGGSQLGTTPTGAQLITNQVDLAMADNALSFTKNSGSTATQTLIGIIPFKFVRGTNSLAVAATITNITDQMFRQNIVGGVPAALYTGVATDTNHFVYISGRNDNSGTRVNTFGETDFGIRATSTQIEMDNTGAMIPPPLGDGGDGVDYTTAQGFDSGGTLATTLGGDSGTKTDQLAPGNPTGFITIAYLGFSDAATATNLGAKELSYNGVFESDQAVIEGRYNFWGNEYALIRKTPSSQASTVYNKMTSTNGFNAHATGGGAISLNAMHCTRGGPTTDPAHN